MNRILLVAVVLMVMVSTCYAYDVSTERIMNQVYDSSGKLNVLSKNPSGTTVTNVRTDVTTNDAIVAENGQPVTPALGSGINTQGYYGIFVDTQAMKLATVTVTPLFGTSSRYYRGTPRTITASTDAYLLATYGCPDVNFEVNAIGICDPTVTLSSATGVTIDARLLN